MKKKAIIGNGNHAKELYAIFDFEYDIFDFDIDVLDTSSNANVFPISKFSPETYDALICVGSSDVREKIVNILPKETTYFTYIHPTALIFDKNIEIGCGSYVGPYSIITKNVNIGKHALINRGNQIGHDCKIGDFFSMMPGSIVSGTCSIGDKVYLGTNSSIKEKTNICNNVIIGLNSGVVKNITIPGVYAGVPVRKIK